MEIPNGEIFQKLGVGSGNTQIGVQINEGMTPSDAIQATFALFREYFPKLKEEALAEVHKMLEEELTEIPHNNIIPPRPKIAVPTLQNASMSDESILREMYAKLLASDMNIIKRSNVHPAFVEIINQLCSDEAKILKELYKKSSIPTINLRYSHEDGSGISIVKNFSNLGEILECYNPEKMDAYFNNLERLGLVDNAKGLSSFTDKSLYEPLKNHSVIKLLCKEELVKAKGYTKVDFTESHITITSFGKNFCTACMR